MENAASELRAQVHALQAGSPNEARIAAERLVLLQRSAGAVPLCARLLQEAIIANDDAVAFIAAQTLASRARLGSAGDADAWPRLAPELVSTLKSSPLPVSAPVLRQICVALARLLVWLVESWMAAVEQLFIEIRGLPEPMAVFEALQALAEEPFNRRLLVDGSRRSKLLLSLKGQVPTILATIGAGASAWPGAVPLRCAAAWLRAQGGFEDWLPMVGFNGAAHPALNALLPVMPTAIRAASMELGYEAFEAAAELFEVAMPLCNSWAVPEAQQSIVPLLGGFVKTSGRLPEDNGIQKSSVDSPLVVAEVLANVVHAAFSSTAPLAVPTVWKGLLTLASRLLTLGALSGSLNVEWDSNCLLGRSLDSWEALAEAYRDAHDAGTFGDATQQMQSSMDVAFSEFVQVLPQALILPQTLSAFPDGLASLRRRVPQLLVMWCDGNETRVANLLAMVTGIAQQLPQLNGATAVPHDSWNKLELVLFLAGAIAEVFASGGDASLQELPDLLAGLCSSLPRLQLVAAPQPWRSLTAAAGAEFITALDPWITPVRCPVRAASTSDLLRFVFEVIADQHGAMAAAEAIVVVVSNLAPQLAKNAEVGQQVCERLHHLCLGGSGLAPQVRERLLRSALGPVLSQLPAEQLDGVMEGLASPLRAAAPPMGGGAADGALASRLLFQLLAAPEVERPAKALAYLSAHWPWLEAALSTSSAEPTVEAACLALTKILSHSRSDPAALQVLERCAPLLMNAAVVRGSVAALSALATLIRIFKGVSSSEDLAKRLAGWIVDGVRGLLRGSSEFVSQLPPDLLSTLLEVLTISLGPRCVLLAPLLLTAQDALLAEVIALVAPTLPSCASPRCLCWALLLADRLPYWLQQSGSHVQSVAQLLEASLPHIGTACCQLLAASPLAADGEVASALAKTLLSLSRASPQALAAALIQAAETVGVASDEGTLLVQQVGDPLQTEEALAEALREAAQNWQAEHLRRTLSPASC